MDTRGLTIRLPGEAHGQVKAVGGLEADVWKHVFLYLLQARWQVAPAVLEFTPASVTKASVTLTKDSGLVLRGQMCPAFFPLEFAGTGTSGYFLSEWLLQQTQCLFQAASASVLRGTASCPPTGHLGVTPLPRSHFQSPWPLSHRDGPFPVGVSGSLHLRAPARSRPSLFLASITAAAS